MDTIPVGISVAQLSFRLGSTHAPLIVDVRRAVAFEADSVVIASAIWRDPYMLNDWMKFMPRHRDIVVYCVHGHEISKNTCSALRGAGLQARYLEGGIEAWNEAKGASTRKGVVESVPSKPNAPSKWITRERPKIDRIACPWLIRRFIDPLAEFIYVPSADVMSRAEQLGAIAYDVPGVTFTHRGDQCSFDALIEDFQIVDPALKAVAEIVRGADTGMPDLTPQSAGLLAISLGLSALHADDHKMLEEGMIVYDALYAWAKSARAEIHNAALFKPK
jgi:rhodanese-related sulfurtransferase